MRVDKKPHPSRITLRFPLALLSLILFSLLSVSANALDGQEELRDLNISRWGVDDGLPQISVLSLAQDRNGYLWIGTQNGIARFDGVRFVIYNRHSSGVDTTVATNALVDSANRVWFSTPRGALYIQNNEVHALARAGDSIGVSGIAEQADGRIVFATESGLYQAEDKQLIPIPGQSDTGQSLLVDGKHLWVGGVGILHDGAAPGAAPIRMPSADLRINVIQRHGGELWLGTDDGVLRVNPHTRSVRSVDPALSGFVITALHWDRDGNLWVGSNGALLRLSQDGRVDRIDGKDIGMQLWVRSIIEGREGQIWVGTYRDSLLRISDNAGHVLNARDGLTDNLVWSLLDDKAGGILIGTNSGLEYRQPDGKLRRVVDGGSLPEPSVYTLAHADNGAIWLGTRRGLALWDNGKISVPPALEPLQPFQINAVLRNGPTDYWIASTNGLYRYRDGQLEHLDSEPGSSVARVRSMLAIGNDSLLIGTEGGLRYVHDGLIERLSWADTLEHSFVTLLTWIGPDQLAIGSMDRGLGLIRLTRKADGSIDPVTLRAAGPLRLIDIDQGLSNRNVWTLDVVGDYLYAGTARGVYRVMLADLLDTADNAEHIDMQYVHAAPGRNARSLQRMTCCNGGGDARSLRVGNAIWYASADGAVRVDTTTFRSRPAPPLPLVESIKNGGTHTPDQPIIMAGEHRDLAVEYTGLSLIESDMIQFRYRLLGYDQNWQLAGTRRVAYYTQLPPGNYRFVVQARHPTGSWSADSLPLLLNVVPYWYERSLIRGLITMILLGLVIGFVLRHHMASRAREEQLERAVAERTLALQRAVNNLRDANVALAEESRTDPLTGLSNRRLDLSRGLGAGTLALIDIDYFKQINDEYGHSCGDHVLIELAGLLRRCVSDEDQIARWGGEEFLLFLSGRTLTQAMKTIETIRCTVAAHRFATLTSHEVTLTCSIGLAEHSGGDAWHITLELADAALYQAKHCGRNTSIGVMVTESAKNPDSQPPLSTWLPALIKSGDLRWISNDTPAREQKPATH